MTTTGNSPSLVVTGLVKKFRRVTAVDDLSFTVEPGRVTGFLGPNGAGKTTTLRMLLGLVAPDRGEATIGGRPYHALPAPSSQVGAVLEASGFHPARSGRSHLRIYSGLNGYPPERVDQVLKLAGLTESARRPVRGYSLGMRQRLALATALLGDPAVLVLDEPFNGLDPEGISWMRGLLRQFAREGRTVLVSSHMLSEMQQLADEVVIIARGRLVRQGSLAELADWHGQVVSVRTPQAEQLMTALADATGGRARLAQTGPESLRVTGVSDTEIGRVASAAGIELHSLASEAGDLEQVFFELTANAGLAGHQPSEVN
ncbi:MAG: ATP-binding cassette domain-containing protein [Actinobacteria bacterium]|nr:ATP-binding cassette domain-containing protein [Actinomycetota bacterium]